MEATDKRSTANALTSGQVIELAWQSLTKEEKERLIFPTVAETMSRSKKVLAETRLVLKQSRAALAQSQRDRERLVKKTAAFGLAAERGPLEVRYDDHLIRVMALTVRETATWTYAALVMWMEDRRVRVKTFLDQPQQFKTASDAVRRGFEVATNWITDGKPDHSP